MFPKKNHSQYHCDTLTRSGKSIRFLDVMQESRKDDHWNIDGFTQFTVLIDKSFLHLCGSGVRFPQTQANTRFDHLWPEIWSGMSKNAQRKEELQWAIDKPKLDNARTMRGTYFIDKEYRGFKETIENARKSWNLLWKQPYFKLTTYRYREICGGSDKYQPKHACIVEAYESTRKRLESTLRKDHDDRIAGKGC